MIKKIINSNIPTVINHNGLWTIKKHLIYNKKSPFGIGSTKGR